MLPEPCGISTKCITNHAAPISRSAWAAATSGSRSTPRTSTARDSSSTGANAPTTAEIIARGEAVHYALRAEELGVPRNTTLIEPEARNTSKNFAFTRALLERQGIDVSSATVVSKPYQQRRACATVRKVWSELEVTSSVRHQELADYTASIDDETRVLDMLVGDTQRLWVNADAGFAEPEEVDPVTLSAYDRLVDAGYTSRLVNSPR